MKYSLIAVLVMTVSSFVYAMNPYYVAPAARAAYERTRLHTQDQLLAAIASGDEARVERLVREYPQILYKLPQAKTWPLFEAIKSDNAALVDLLINHGAALGDYDSEGNGCLHLIAQGKTSTGRQLLNGVVIARRILDAAQRNHRGVDLFRRNRLKQTPMAIAQKNNGRELAQLFAEYHTAHDPAPQRTQNELKNSGRSRFNWKYLLMSGAAAGVVYYLYTKYFKNDDEQEKKERRNYA